jgi:isoamylase
MAGRVRAGRATPLGATIVTCAAGKLVVNFAVHARPSGTLHLCLFPPISAAPDATVTRDLLCPPIPLHACTGHVHHVEVSGIDVDCAYAYWIAGSPRLLLDPRARHVESPPARLWGRYEGERYRTGGSVDGRASAAERVEEFIASHKSLAELGVKYPFRLARVTGPEASRLFDWGDDAPPRVPFKDLVVYEAHVRGLTAALPAEDVAPHTPGTFAAAIKRLDYLRDLGVTAVQLMPIAEFNELERDPMDELRQLRRERGGADGEPTRTLNVWGYAPLQPAAFVPMGRYGATPTSSPEELKLLVQAMHARGMECLLDVVYNHVAGASCSLHFLGVSADYFLMDGKHSNVSGCGNTLSANSPCMAALILDSLRWLTSEFRIDGFRIDAAGVLARDGAGKAMCGPAGSAVLTAIEGDPVLAGRVKLIVEPWDAGDGVGSPNFLMGKYPLRAALEWNPDFGRAVRRFLFRGDDGERGREYARAFCKAVRGSKAMYGGRPHGAAHSVNYLSCHDGFSLHDSASFAKRTNADGYEDPTTCNHGAEGPTTDARVNRLRARQLRNLMVALTVARGTPMLSQGCEAGLSKGGNNNCYDVDGAANWLARDVESSEFAAFTREALALRRTQQRLHGADFYDGLEWRAPSGRIRSRGSGRRGGDGDVEAESAGFAGWTVGDLFVAFNAAGKRQAVTLPGRGGDGAWRRLCDTAASDGAYFKAGGDSSDDGTVCAGGQVCMEAKSASIFVRQQP